jgi:hypothetical protein
MRSTFDLDELPLSERYAYWRDVSETLHVPVSVSCDKQRPSRRSGTDVYWEGSSSDRRYCLDAR